MRAIPLLLFIASAASGQQVQKAELAEYISKQHASETTKWNEATAALKKRLQGAKSGTVTARVRDVEEITTPNGVRFLFPTVQSKTDTIAKLTKELAEVKAPMGPKLPVMLAHRMTVGCAGELRGLMGFRDEDKIGREALVLEILDARSAVVRMGTFARAPTPNGGYVSEDGRKEFILSIDTSKLADGSTVDAGGACYEVTGTRKVGATTYLVVERIDPAPFFPKP